ADGAIEGVLDTAAKVPGEKLTDIADYEDRAFMPGREQDCVRPLPESARWSLGYAQAGIVPDDLTERAYYLGGYLAYPPNRAEGVIDDLRVRTIAIDDGSGRGTVVFSEIDCVGISSRDIADIRLTLKKFALEHNVVSINVGAIHCHSGIDTQGLWGDLKTAAMHNTVNIMKKDPDAVVSGRDPIFMQELKGKVVRTVEDAVTAMTPGRLAYTVADGSAYSHSKRPPYVTDSRMLALKFVPDDGSAPTVAVEFPSHPVSLGYSNKMLSGDFVYYMCDELEKQGFNGMYFQGAELAVASNRGDFAPQGSDNMKTIECYGRAIARHVIDSGFTGELAPRMDAAHARVYMPVGNKLYVFLRKLGIINNDMLSDGKQFRFPTEIGIVELGEIALLLVPGELAPELLMGGALGTDDSYTHTEWKNPPLKDLIPGKQCFVVGLMNDAIGYIIPDNDYGSFVAPLHYEESVSAGRHTASQIVSAFSRLAADNASRKTGAEKDAAINALMQKEAAPQPVG
ncbi:MAG: hypothetical protein K6C36_04440, partial [Clostridia bacterium]|nr:hypothetical protein [Clostridia bacterium]